LYVVVIMSPPVSLSIQIIARLPRYN
jgi:hypothetical protein